MQLQDRELHRRIKGHVHPQFTVNAVFLVLEHAVAKAVAGDVRAVAAPWQRGG